MARRRTKGSGLLRLRGRTWQIGYTVNGKQVFESSGTDNRDIAEAMLKEKLGATAKGQDISPQKATIHDLCQLVLADHETRQMAETKVVKWRYEKHIKPSLGNLPASRFGSAQVREYIKMRRRVNSATNATINRELSIIRRGFTLGFQEEPQLVTRKPFIMKLPEDNARQGFLPPETYEKLCNVLPDRLKAYFAIAYHVGTRKGELRKIQWTQIDFEERLIRLETGQTKNKKARSLPFFGDMEEWLLWQRNRCPKDCRYVFFHYAKPVSNQLRGWREACIEAGVPELLFHDLRRTAVRNMRLAGVEQSVRMKISGHKTASMEQRYNILDHADLDDAATKMDAHFKKTQKSLRRVK
jgi:integrase